jgi:hypothetical protein
MEAYGQRLSIRFCSHAKIPTGVTIYRSIDTPPPQNKLKQFYLLPPIGGVIGGQFTITRHESYASTFANIFLLVFALISRSMGAVDILRFFSEARDRE